MEIRVNLLPAPQRRRGGGGGGIGKISMPAVGDMFAKVKDPLLIGVVAAWIVGVLVVGVLFTTASASWRSVEQEREQAEAEARRFRNLMAEKRRAENLRDSLVAELRAIRNIDSDRYVWPHIMEEVTRALPDYTWLVALEAMAPRPVADTGGVPPVRFQVTGRTSDISAYTRFVRQLANSPWLYNLEFGAATAVVEDDRTVTAFNVTGQFRVADSAYIRTVPVGASVR